MSEHPSPNDLPWGSDRRVVPADEERAEARFARQRDLVPAPQLGRYTGLVVGVGAVGRQVAVMLAAAGAPRLVVVDDDGVEPHNLAAQGYRGGDLGRAKALCCAEACREVADRATEVRAVRERFKRSSLDDPRSPLRPILAGDASRRIAVFCCVDSMAARRAVWEATRTRASFFVDGRMAGETLRVLASANPFLDEAYPRTLFDDGSAHPAPCTGRSTLYAASVCAGLMLARFAALLRAESTGGAPGFAPDVVLNLAADELTVLGREDDAGPSST